MEPNKNNEIVKAIIREILSDCENIIKVHKEDIQHCDIVVKKPCEVMRQAKAMNNYIIKQPTEEPSDTPSVTSSKGNKT